MKKNLFLCLAISICLVIPGISNAFPSFTAPPITTAPNINGVVNSSEWSAASAYNLNFINSAGDLEPTTWYFMNDGSYLYIGVKTSTSAHWDTIAGFGIDGNNDNYASGNPAGPHQDFTVGQACSSGWSGHTSYVVYNGGTTHVSPPSGLQRATYGSSNISYEFRIPISTLNMASDTIAIRFWLLQGGLDSSLYQFFYPEYTTGPTWETVAQWPRLTIGTSCNLTQIEAFVTRFYQECLGRNPDSGGLNGWCNYLCSGSKTGAEVAYGFVFSPEYLGTNATDQEFLYVLYEAFFNRQPDTAGYDRWLTELSVQTPIVGQTAARKNVLNGFLGSPEFKNLCDEYGITRGTATYINPNIITPPSSSLPGTYTLTDFLVISNGTSYGPSYFSSWSGTAQIGKSTLNQSFTFNEISLNISQTYSTTPATGTYEGIINTTSDTGVNYNIYYYTSGNLLVTFVDTSVFGIPGSETDYWLKKSNIYSISSRKRISSSEDGLDSNNYHLGAIIGEIIK